MAKEKKQAVDDAAPVRVRILDEVRIDELSLIFRPGDKVKLSATLAGDARLKGKFEPIG